MAPTPRPSWRAFAKAIVPAAGTVAALGIEWLATGAFDRAELATALTGLLSAVVVYLVPNAPPP